ncbi:MAG TPA: hypothetical protein VE053_13060 [Allosphingosinicella sp.]|nr:hypothetical protein [Allosphingosinicella sp.]
MMKGFKRMSSTMLASVALAAAGLFAPAPAQANFGPRCYLAVWQYCSANWQALGFYSADDCAWYWTDVACNQYPHQPWDPNWPYLPPVP